MPNHLAIYYYYVLILPLIQNAFCNVVQHDIIKPTADIRDTSGGAVRRGRMGGGKRGEEGGKARRRKGKGSDHGDRIFTDSSNILQEVCQSRSAPAECVGRG